MSCHQAGSFETIVILVESGGTGKRRTWWAYRDDIYTGTNFKARDALVQSPWLVYGETAMSSWIQMGDTRARCYDRMKPGFKL